MNLKTSLAAAVALVAVLASTAFAQDPRDIRLADDIGRSLTSYVRLTIFDDINATVENGAVVLTGRVTMPYKKDDLEKRIAKIDGVRECPERHRRAAGVAVRRRAAVPCVTRDLRQPVVLELRRDGNPPIHIIVEGGHVTLAGVVNSNVERMLARSLATGLGELSVDQRAQDRRGSEERVSDRSGTERAACFSAALAQR